MKIRSSHSTLVAWLANLALVLVFSSVIAATPSLAQSPAAPPLFESTTEGLPPLKWRGGGLLRVFGFQVYYSHLWTPDGAPFDPSKPFALDIQYLRNFEGKKLAERSIDEMRGQSVGNDSVYPKWLAEMIRVFPNVKPNDRLTGIHTPNRTVRFFHNGKFVGEVNDSAFANAFFGIWLSANTSQPQLRERMLGGK